MFEFLKECNNFEIYERAVSCEKIIGDVNDILIFRVFCEAAIKSIYYKENGLNPSTTKIVFKELLKDSELKDILVSKYGFNSIGTLDRIIRVRGNSAAHDEHPEKSSDESRIQQFLCVYTLASCIYHVRTGKTAPSITRKEIAALIEKKKNPKDIDKIISDFTEQIAEIEAELAAEKAGNAESDAKIAALESKANEALEKAAKAEEQKKKAEEQLENERYKNIDSSKLDELQQKIDEQEKIISSFEGDINILKNRLEKAEKNNNEEELNKLQRKNQNLLDRLESAKSERDDFKKQLETLADNSCDKSVVEKLQKELATAKKELDSQSKILEKTKKELETERGKKSKVDTSLSDLEDQFKEYKELVENLNNLSNERQRIKQWVDTNSPYTCCNCKSRLKLSKKMAGWYCPNWKKEKERRLPSAYLETTLQDRTVFIEPLLKLDSAIQQEKGRISEWLRTNAPGANPYTPIKAPDDVLEESETKTIDFEPYPLSLTQYEPKSAIFQSLSVPAEVFKQRKELGLNNHSKFRVWYDPILTNNIQAPTEQERTIYSLVLRLLNRGIVLETNADIGHLLKKKFNVNQYGKANILTDYIEYSNPVLSCDSERERRFAQDYFPEILGKSWASYVTAQPAFDELLSTDYNRYEDRRADFLVAGYSNLIRPLIIELDGYEHKDSFIYDSSRRMALRNSGYEVISFNNHDIDNRKESVSEDLKNYFDVERENPTVEVDDKYLVACKIEHQFAIAIVKALELGYVGKKVRFAANVSSTMFNSAEIGFILDAAISEVELLISKYCELYGFDIDCDLKDETAREIKISIGDGQPGYSGITIRDNYFKWDYLCDLVKFNPEIQPSKTIRESTLRFFLKYIFGHKKFNPGQLPAIKRLLRKEDCVALLPTGSGKSIIYQLTSYLAPGMIVVISPLKALINDQISNLEYLNGINNAIGIISRSGKDSREQKKKDLQHMKCNASSLLYIAPERLQIPEFRYSIAEMLRSNNVFAVAIDEAHCVSEWGHDFRPSYLVIGKNCRKLFSDESGKPAIAALTGTASTRVREDILRILKIERKSVIYPDTFERNNLIFSVIECDSDEKVENLSYIIREDIPEMFDTDFDTFRVRNGAKTNSGIVFTPFTKGRSTEYAASSIETSLQEKIPDLRMATYYSATPDGYDKATWEAILAENAKLFRENEINLLVATKAFGMGIDKGNIRFTIHDCFPSSIESFYQEAGRAGRDNEVSQCIVLFSDDNREENAQLMDASLSLEDLRNKYNMSTSSDDVHTRLYFHLTGFRGVENESTTVNKIINCLPIDAKPGDELYLSINNPTFTNAETFDNGKAIAQAVVRLMNLGVFEDYLYDYVKSEFIIKVGNTDRKSVDKHYSEYVASYNIADVPKQTAELQKIQGDERTALKSIVTLMIAYTYSQIEHGRRQQLIRIYELMLNVLSQNASNQDREIKDQINNYFALPEKTKGDPIVEILESAEIRFDVALSVFDTDQGKTQFDSEELKNAALIAGRAAHELESASTRPDLILLRDIAQIIAGGYNNRIVANDLVAVARFASEQYYIEPEAIDEALERTYDLVLARDTELFDEILNRMSQYRKRSKSKLMVSLMKSNNISDENREYLTMKYFTDKVQHML